MALTLNEQIGIRIQKCLKQKKMKQNELAAKMDVQWSRVSKWCCGRSGLTIPHLMQVAKFLDTTTDYLLFGDDNDRSMETQEVAESRTD